MPTTISTINDGWSALAEAVIKWAIRDMNSKTLVREKYFACKFLTNEEWKDLYTGLAPNMIHDWENAEPKAKRILETQLANYDPRREII